MKRRVSILAAVTIGTLALVVGTSTAHAGLNKDQLKCVKTIAKEGLKFVKGQLKLRQQCWNTKLQGDSCALPADPAALQGLVDKLRSGLAKGCTFDTNTPGNLATIGFPGPCLDVNSGDGFTLTDLQDCIEDTHRDASADMIDNEYDADLTTLVEPPLTCQKEIAKSLAKYVAAYIKNVQKCRTGLLDCKLKDGIETCKVSGVLPANCATGDAKTATAIGKADTKARDAIVKKCSVADLTTIQACEPDETNPTLAANCAIAFHRLLIDNPDLTADSDLMDYEYAQPGVCGDNRKNTSREECDGTDAVDCPGQCGGPLSLFSCRCQNTKRFRAVEHANADLDNGYSGVSHDSGIVEGGGYVSDLWDCDGPGGPDTLCNAGPHCDGGLETPCAPVLFGTTKRPLATLDSGNEICAAAGDGQCRRTVGGSMGPHCETTIDQWCATDVDCPGDETCLKTLHTAPLPLGSGGISVCVVNTFTEDVVGTRDVATGSSAARLRQNSATYLGPDQQQPCPVCGGFCSGNAGPFSPGTRNLCTTDADCTAPATCVHDNVCNWGPNKDQACNPNTPIGGPTQFFGNTSIDCPMDGSLLGTIDILFNPTTTGVVSLTANTDCATAGFNDKRCAGGPNQHAVCTVDSECPGGTCNEQCFCPGGPGQNQKPNACEAACVGGPDDAQPCVDNSECTAPGFCHPADCRLNDNHCDGGPNHDVLCTVDSECPGGTCGDLDSCQEGRCTVGPADKTCSIHTFVSCTSDADCRPSGSCSFCDESETCVTKVRQCFVNPTITRCGAPGVPDHVNTAVFCEARTSSAAVNNTAGVPGPAAQTTHITDYEVGF